MEHPDARDNFDHSNFDHSTVDDGTPTSVGDSSESSGFSTATGAGTSMGGRPNPHASGAAKQSDAGAEQVDGPLEQGTDPHVVGDRDEPDLPVRTNTGQPETAGSLPHESDIEQRLAAAARTPHREAGEPDAAFGS